MRLCPHDITIIVVALLTSEFVSCSQGLKILAMSRLCPFNHGTRGRGQSSKIPQNRNPIYQLEKIISVLHQNELDIQNLILPCIPQKLGYINVFSSTTLTFTDGLVFDNVLIMMFSFE